MIVSMNLLYRKMETPYLNNGRIDFKKSIVVLLMNIKYFSHQMELVSLLTSCTHVVKVIFWSTPNQSSSRPVLPLA